MEVKMDWREAQKTQLSASAHTNRKIRNSFDMRHWSIVGETFV